MQLILRNFAIVTGLALLLLLVYPLAARLLVAPSEAVHSAALTPIVFLTLASWSLFALSVYLDVTARKYFDVDKLKSSASVKVRHTIGVSFVVAKWLALAAVAGIVAALIEPLVMPLFCKAGMIVYCI